MSHFLMILLLVGAASLQASLAAHFGSHRVDNSIRLEDKNSISAESGNIDAVSETGETNRVDQKEYVLVTRVSPAKQTFLHGDRIEIECEAVGKPPPAIQWMRGRELIVQDEVNAISNLLTTESTTGMAKVKSRLVWDCAKPMHQGTYTCVAQSGEQTAVADPANIIVAGSSTGNQSCRRSEIMRPPRITSFAPVIMDLIGSDVILPCAAEGVSRPGIFWLNPDKQVLTPRHLRFKVLNSGSLYVHKLRWDDMGEYICVAQNDAGRDTASTFLYPVTE